jgi:hypothetical protein
MDDYPHATDDALDQTGEEKLVISDFTVSDFTVFDFTVSDFAVSDEELEKAAGGTPSAQTYPSTGVATICVPDSPFPKKLRGQMTPAR